MSKVSPVTKLPGAVGVIMTIICRLFADTTGRAMAALCAQSTSNGIELDAVCP